MRMTLISMLTVAVLSVAICVFSLMRIGEVSEEMDALRMEVLSLAGEERLTEAHHLLQQISEIWRNHEQTLAVLAPHDALHEITRLIIEGDANLTAGDLDDFNRSMALLGEAIQHLHEEERFTLSNIL